MSCNICLTKYNHSLNMPISLACPHTICASCEKSVSFLFFIPSPHTHHHIFPHHQVRACPYCRAEITKTHVNLGLLEVIPETKQDALVNELGHKIERVKQIFVDFKTYREDRRKEGSYYSFIVSIILDIYFL